MSYNNSIPQATDNPSDSQAQILANFSQLDIQYGSSGDHVQWTAVANNGKHKKVTWINQAVAPASTTDEVVAYSNTQSGITMPYYKRDGLATVYPLAPIKAYARITSTGADGGQTLSNSFNITSVTRTPILIFTVVITNAMLNATNYSIFISDSIGRSFAYNTIDANTFTFSPSNNVPNGEIISIIVVEP